MRKVRCLAFPAGATFRFPRRVPSNSDPHKHHLGLWWGRTPQSCLFSHRQRQAAEMSIPSPASMERAGPWHVPWTQLLAGRKRQVGVSGKLWPHGLKMIISVPLPGHLGCSSAHHPCWLICVHSSPCCAHGEGGHCGRCPRWEAALQHHSGWALISIWVAIGQLHSCLQGSVPDWHGLAKGTYLKWPAFLVACPFKSHRSQTWLSAFYRVFWAMCAWKHMCSHYIWTLLWNSIV